MKFKEKWAVKINFDAEIGIKVHIREKKTQNGNFYEKNSTDFYLKIASVHR